MSKVLIGGGTGLVGQALAKNLAAAGHQVSILSRREQPNSDVPVYLWDVEAGTIDDRAVAEADVIVNLAGEGIADGRWTDAQKRRIIRSRTQSAELIKAAMQRVGHAEQKTYISAAAQGFYGNRAHAWVTENEAPAGVGFLSESCVAWEKAANSVAESGVRLVVFRIGIVLSMRGGALPQMIMPYKFGMATYFGYGQQYYSWLHINDLCNMIKYSIEHPDIKGVYNAATPNPVTNRQFAAAIATARGGFALPIPVPIFALRMALGDMADTVLTSTRLNVDKIVQTGFEFEYPDLVPALKNLGANNL